jgi:phage virion morphogenesis protein
MPGIISLNVNVAGVSAKLKALQQAADDKQAVFGRVGAAILTKVQLGFKTTTDPWGNQWSPLKYRRGQALSDTGRLRRSIRSVADADGVTVGTNLKYARIHQFGGKLKERNQVLIFGAGGKFISRKQAKRSFFVSNIAFSKIGEGKIPARPYLPLNADGEVALPPTWQKPIVDRLKAHFMRAVREAA